MAAGSPIWPSATTAFFTRSGGADGSSTSSDSSRTASLNFTSPSACTASRRTYSSLLRARRDRAGPARSKDEYVRLEAVQALGEVKFKEAVLELSLPAPTVVSTAS